MWMTGPFVNEIANIMQMKHHEFETADWMCSLLTAGTESRFDEIKSPSTQENSVLIQAALDWVLDWKAKQWSWSGCLQS
jgi:hypothetical protein